jgi:hypothetical protein
MTNEEKVQHWIKISDEDLKVGATMLQGGHYLYAGFMPDSSTKFNEPA